MRINKYIATSGFCSRRKADKLIDDGVVTIDGKVAKPGDDADEHSSVKVNGIALTIEGKEDIYLILNKPVGVITTADENADNTVFDYIDLEDRLFYIGRLDVASSGLLLMTNNGDVANKISSPKNEHEKEYIVSVNKKMTRAFLDNMRKGVVIDDSRTKPAHIKKMTDVKFKMVITEGRNRQIRRMTEALGYEVKSLKRIRVMNLKIRELGEGNWRYLSKNERRELLDQLK